MADARRDIYGYKLTQPGDGLVGLVLHGSSGSLAVGGTHPTASADICSLEMRTG